MACLQAWRLTASTGCRGTWRWFRNFASWWITVRMKGAWLCPPSGQPAPIIVYLWMEKTSSSHVVSVPLLIVWYMQTHMNCPHHHHLMSDHLSANCCFLQSELWPLTAVTCSPWIWCKVVLRLAGKKTKKNKIQLSRIVLSYGSALLPH